VKVWKKIKRQILNIYLDCLNAHAHRLISRGYELEDKAIRLEIKLEELEEIEAK